MNTSYQTSFHYKGSIIRQRGDAWQVETNLAGRRKRCTKPTQAKAKAYAAAVAEQTKEDGARALELTGPQREEAVQALKDFPTEAIRRAAREALEILSDSTGRTDASDALSILRGEAPVNSLQKPRHTPLAEAARFWLRHHPEGQTPPLLEPLLADYLKAKKHRRPSTLYEIDNKLHRFCRSFPDASVAEITTDDIDTWLNANTSSLSNRRKYHRLLHAYFDYAQRKWRLESNPTDNVFIDRGEQDEVLPEAYSVEEVRRILTAASKDKDAATVVPVLVIGLFSGLRPSEIQHLTWEDIDFEERHIRVRPETAKRRRQRFVEMSDNMLEWLNPYARETGPASPPDITFRRARSRIIEAAKVTRWLRDGLRHTYATYHLAHHQNPSKTAFEMGHRGNADLVFEHYRQLAKKSDAALFWQIKPGSTTG
jgi:integrase/recombinase XerD